MAGSPDILDLEIYLRAAAWVGISLHGTAVETGWQHERIDRHAAYEVFGEVQSRAKDQQGQQQSRTGEDDEQTGDVQEDGSWQSFGKARQEEMRDSIREEAGRDVREEPPPDPDVG